MKMTLNEYERMMSKAADKISELYDQRAKLVKALKIAADQIDYLQELSGTKKHGPLDVLVQIRALLAKIKKKGKP